MLIATLTVLYLLFFAGPQGGLVEQIDDAFSAVTDAVTSAERAAEVQAALEEMRSAANAFEQQVQDLRDEFFEVDANYNATREDYEQLFAQLDVAWMQMQRRVVTLRYRMLGSMTREEWYAVFGTPEVD